jgi:hypothetical protein
MYIYSPPKGTEIIPQLFLVDRALASSSTGYRHNDVRPAPISLLGRTTCSRTQSEAPIDRLGHFLGTDRIEIIQDNTSE